MAGTGLRSFSVVPPQGFCGPINLHPAQSNDAAAENARIVDFRGLCAHKSRDLLALLAERFPTESKLGLRYLLRTCGAEISCCWRFCAGCSASSPLPPGHSCNVCGDILDQ